MKRIQLIIISLVIGASVLLMKKQASAFEFALGPKVDLGMGFFLGKDWHDILVANNFDNRVVLTVSGGIMFDMTFVRKGIFGFGLQPEILFTLTGGGWTYDSDYYHTEAMKGIEIPLYFKPRLKAGSGDFYFLLGPDIFVPIGDMDVKVIYPGGSSHYHDEIDAKVLVGLGIGIGYDLYLGPGKLELGCIFTPYFIDYLDHSNIRQNKFVFTVGYAFNVVK